MNKLENKGNWHLTKGKLKRNWGNLTNDDLQYAAVKQDERLGRIRKKPGGSREACEKAVREASSSN